MNKIQCISNGSGFYDIKLGKWYFAEEFISYYRIFESNELIGIYDKELFRTLSEVRNIKINKLIKKN